MKPFLTLLIAKPFKLSITSYVYTVHNGCSDNGYSDNFAALGVSPSKSHTNFIGYSDNSCTDFTQILDF